MHFYNTGRMGLVTCDAPMCLGHEAAGIIVQLGSNIAAQAAEADKAAADLANGDSGSKVKALPKKVLRLGDRVALEPGVTCRMCDDCRGGRYQVCPLFQSWRQVANDGTEAKEGCLERESLGCRAPGGSYRSFGRGRKGTLAAEQVRARRSMPGCCSRA